MMAGSEASEHIHFGKYNFHDFIIENGAISYHNVIKIDDMPVCKQNTTGAREQERRCQEHWNVNNLAKLFERHKISSIVWVPFCWGWIETVSLLAILFQGEILCVCVRNPEIPLQDLFSLELSKAPAPTAGAFE